MEGLQQKLSGPSAPLPDFCKDLSSDSWYEIEDFDLNQSEPGKLTFSVDDEKASDKRAVKVPGDQHAWAITCVLPYSDQALTPTGEAKEIPKYRLYAAVRCDAKEGVDGTAMTTGVCAHGRDILIKPVSVADIRGAEYRWIDVGAVTLLQHSYIWFAPPGRPGEVDSVYIDRIVVVRER